MAKKRLDITLVERGLAETRQKAQALVMAGKVLVGDCPEDKAGRLIDENAAIRLRGEISKYVSRGGEKLEGALTAFGIDVMGLDAIDIGASTGGFTDCLLKHGARSVTAVDVGYGQLAESLRTDPRVTVFEKTNARNISPETLGGLFDIATIDVSFISLLKVLPAVIKLLNENAVILALVKPQFESGREAVGKGGVVRDSQTHLKVLNDVIKGITEIGLSAVSLIHSPLMGPKGNIEFFLLITKKTIESKPPDIPAAVEIAHLSFKTQCY